MIPLTGYIMIPLGLALMVMPWRYFAIGFGIAAVMSAAAVVNAGGFGLQPGYYFALLLIARVAFRILVLREAFRIDALRAMLPLLLFIIAAVFSLFVALMFFQGKIEVLNGAAGFKTTLVQAFRFGRDNLTQLAYVLLNVAMLYCVCHEFARLPADKVAEIADRAMITVLCFVVLVTLWHVTSLYTGIYYASDFFFTNAAYKISDGQAVGGGFRANGPFEEPSALGLACGGLLFFAYRHYRAQPTAGSAVMLIGVVVTLFVAASTGGFFGFALCGALIGYDVMTGRLRLLHRPSEMSSGQWAMIAGAIGLVLLIMLVVATHSDIVRAMFQKVVLEKSGTSSFAERTNADLLGIKALIDSYGIGVGIGSHKANSLAAMLLSNTGLIGTICFVAFIAQIVVLGRTREGPRLLHPTPFDRIAPMQMAVMGSMVVHCVSGGNLSTMLSWFYIAMALNQILAAERHTQLAMRSVPLTRETRAQRFLRPASALGS